MGAIQSTTSLQVREPVILEMGADSTFQGSIAPNPGQRHRGRSPCGSDEMMVTITGDEVRVTGRPLKAKGERGKVEDEKNAIEQVFPSSFLLPTFAFRLALAR